LRIFCLGGTGYQTYIVMNSKKMNHRPFTIQAVLFDFDGTLTKPGGLDFSEFKKQIGCPQNTPVLEFIEAVSDQDRRRRLYSDLDKFEITAAGHSHPCEGAEELIVYLRGKGVRVGIVSRNSRRSIDRAFMNFSSTSIDHFDVIVSRDDPVKPKPSGDAILLAIRKLHLDPEKVMFIGDYAFDIDAGREAGVRTVFFDHGTVTAGSVNGQDHTVPNFKELQPLIRLGLPLSAGKFPSDLLESFFDDLDFSDPFLLIPPGIGEDAAAVDIHGLDVLVLKSDPITFATDAIGRYAVLVNANDIATVGAIPRWFLATLLFPCGTTPSHVFQVLDEINALCRQNGITLCGGHTEITDAVNRPVATGMLAGIIERSRLIQKQGIRPGDKILLTKGVAVEGTAIIAREFEAKLKDFAFSEAEIRHCKEFLSEISILKEAGIAAEFCDVSAMHDVTEGGIAAAIQELSTAGNHRIRIYLEKIPVYPQTEKICRALHINPMGLIGSGSLLICCRKKSCKALIERIRDSGINISCIGEVLEEGKGIEAISGTDVVEWPCFEADEITRLFSDGVGGRGAAG